MSRISTIHAFLSVSAALGYPNYSPEKQRDQPVTTKSPCLCCGKQTSHKKKLCSAECHAKHKGKK